MRIIVVLDPAGGDKARIGLQYLESWPFDISVLRIVSPTASIHQGRRTLLNDKIRVVSTPTGVVSFPCIITIKT